MAVAYGAPSAERPRGLFGSKREGFHSKAAADKRGAEALSCPNNFASKTALSASSRIIIDATDSDDGGSDSSSSSIYHTAASQTNESTCAPAAGETSASTQRRIISQDPTKPSATVSVEGAQVKRRILPWATSSAPTKRIRVPTSDSDVPAKSAPIATVNTVLSGPQQEILNLVLNRKENVFFTGSAGTGKSYLLRHIIKSLRDKYGESKVMVTASTGMAACNIGGTTLHSFAGIGLGKGDIKACMKSIHQSRGNQAKMRWLRTQVLVIDEVSMVDGDLFDKLENVARLVRKNDKPFGGIQLVITGDFFQLPPVGTDKFCFRAQSWEATIAHTIALKEVFRQTDDTFVNMLNEMRMGKLSPSTRLQFSRLARRLEFNDGVEPTELFATRQEVQTANQTRLAMIQEPPKTFDAMDTGAPHALRLLEPCIALPVLVLKKGAQVMLIKNLDDTLVNGSQGKIIDFMTKEEFDIKTPSNGIDEEILKILHTTAANAVESVRKIARSNDQKTDGDGAPPEPKPSLKFPVVSFIQPHGPPRDVLCVPEKWSIEDPNNPEAKLATRMQVPLLLSWAMSIHKAQGQTLSRVKVDLGRVFEKGQAYVALSRATSLDGLQVLKFQEHRVMAHPMVIEWNKRLMGLA